MSPTTPRWAFVLATVLGAGLLGCLSVGQAALAKSPTGDFAGFRQCPRFTAGVELCLLARITGGEVQIGKLDVPIEREILFQGGIVPNGGSSHEIFVQALGGATLSKTPLSVPGGLSGLIQASLLPVPLRASFAQVGGQSVTAINELVGLPTINTSNLEIREGTGLSLPVRVKLENRFLGNECYIGSASAPVILNLTTGTTSPPKPNTPITGRFGKLAFRDELNLVELTNDVLVDNSFSAPGATGCGGSLSSLLDPMIDAKVGLPSKPGVSTAILRDTILEASTEGVIGSEK